MKTGNKLQICFRKHGINKLMNNDSCLNQQLNNDVRSKDYNECSRAFLLQMLSQAITLLKGIFFIICIYFAGDQVSFTFLFQHLMPILLNYKIFKNDQRTATAGI
jgi:hypothetical protein